MSNSLIRALLLNGGRGGLGGGGGGAGGIFGPVQNPLSGLANAVAMIPQAIRAREDEERERRHLERERELGLMSKRLRIERTKGEIARSKAAESRLVEDRQRKLQDEGEAEAHESARHEARYVAGGLDPERDSDVLSDIFGRFPMLEEEERGRRESSLDLEESGFDLEAKRRKLPLELDLLRAQAVDERRGPSATGAKPRPIFVKADGYEDGVYANYVNGQWFHPETGEPLTGVVQGPTAQMRNTAEEKKAAIKSLNVLEGLSGILIQERGPVQAALAAGQSVESVMGTNSTYRTYVDFGQTAALNIASIINKGRPGVVDQESVYKMIPKPFTDSKESQRLKMMVLNDLLGGAEWSWEAFTEITGEQPPAYLLERAQDGGAGGGAVDPEDAALLDELGF